MASAESRSPQSSNFEFVQEYMRKASDFSCCPSSSSNPESYDRSGDAVNRLDRRIPGCMPTMPYNLDSSHRNLVPETNWWPLLQPTCRQQKDFWQEQLNALELEVLSADCFDQSVKLSGPKKKDMGEFWYTEDHLMDLDSFNLSSEEPEKLCSDLESHWIGAEKTVPWWWKADKDELASLVFLKSLEHVENCDLPRPQAENVGRAASACPQSSYHSKIVDSSADHADEGISNLGNYAQGSPTSVTMDETQCTSSDVGVSPPGSDEPFRSTSSGNIGPNKTNMDKAESPRRPGNDLSKHELLEALCHSQTRAREAEKAAQAAYDEKEHIAMLFLRQASHLFAYRLWFQILQLENLCLELKNKDQPTSVQFPDFFPWAPFKRRRLRKGSRRKAAKRKPRPPRNKICKYAVAFAVGLSLAGAGLFLGWTMGWFFPAL